jgi:hypothetical protein
MNVRVLAMLAAAAAGLALSGALLWHCSRLPPEPQPAPPVPVAVPAIDTQALARAERARAAQSLLPEIRATNRKLQADRARLVLIEQRFLQHDEISREDFDWIKALADARDMDPRARRNNEFFAELRRRVDSVPEALLLAHLLREDAATHGNVEAALHEINSAAGCAPFRRRRADAADLAALAGTLPGCAGHDPVSAARLRDLLPEMAGLAAATGATSGQ